MNFFIEVSGTEYRLYRYRGEVFFIVKYKFGKYYTSHSYEYEPIIEELKDWVIEIVNENKENTTHITFNYDLIIKPMFTKHIREEKLKKILE